jgi:hypothetical protein
MSTPRAQTKFLLMRNSYVFGDADLVQLTQADIDLMMTAVSVCTRSGGGSDMHSLYLKLRDITRSESILDSEVWDYKKIVHREVEEFYLEEENQDAAE